MDISAKLDDREVQAALDRIAAKVGDMKTVMTRIGAMYERRVLENFQNESAPDGSKWKPLAEATMLMGLKKNKGWRPVRGGLSARGKRYLTGKRILWEKGDLFGSIHFQADADSVTIGTSGSILYDAIQQLGGKAGRGKKVTIPAREYLAMNDDGELTLAEVDRNWILDVLGEEMASW